MRSFCFWTKVERQFAEVEKSDDLSVSGRLSSFLMVVVLEHCCIQDTQASSDHSGINEAWGKASLTVYTQQATCTWVWQPKTWTAYSFFFGVTSLFFPTFLHQNFHDPEQHSSCCIVLSDIIEALSILILATGSTNIKYNIFIFPFPFLPFFTDSQVHSILSCFLSSFQTPHTLCKQLLYIITYNCTPFNTLEK